MKNYFVFLFYFILLSVSFSDVFYDRVNAYLITQSGKTIAENKEVIFADTKNGLVLIEWPFSFPAPDDFTLPTPEQAEQILSDYASQKEAQRQSDKPLEQRQYENQFFSLTEELFNLTGVTNDVTPKLGFPELQAKIEQIQATDPMAAVNLSLKLLTIDAALKRYDALWWDDAIQHELPEE